MPLCLPHPQLPYQAIGVDMVLECTGVFLTRTKLAPYFEMGVKKVVVSAPVKDAEDPVLNIVYGVNHVSAAIIVAPSPRQSHGVTRCCQIARLQGIAARHRHRG